MRETQNGSGGETEPGAETPLGTIAHEIQLPDDFLRQTALNAYVGYWVGSGIGFIQAGFSSDPADVIESGTLLRYSNIGVLAAVGIGIMYPLAKCMLATIRARRRVGYDAIIENSDRKLERKRTLYLPSTSSFHSWDLRIFLMSQAAAILGAVIATQVGSEEQKAFGDLVGRSMGTVAGTIVSLLIPPMLCRYIANRLGTQAVAPIKTRSSLSESRHDVPFFSRLFFGAFMSYVGMSVISTPTDENGDFDQETFDFFRFKGVLFFSSAAVLSPVFFAIERFFFSCCSLNEAGELSTSMFQPARWFRISRMDLPSYMRLFMGVVALATVSLVESTYHQNPDDGIYTGLIYGGGIVAWALPVISAGFGWLLAKCGLLNNASETPSALKLSFDMPLMARAAFSTLGGAMIGDAFYYATTNADTYDFDAPPSVLPVIAMWTSFSLSMITPFVMSLAQRCGFTHPIFNPMDDDKDDLTLPWETRTLLGLWLGALAGAAVAYFSADTDNINIILGYIGPEFLGINNAYAAPTTALIFAAVGLLWPLEQYAGEKVKASLAGRFACFNAADRSGQQQGGIQMEDNRATSFTS